VSRVLIVDDEPGIRQMIGEALKREGHESAMAKDGNEALQAAESQEFDLVITDLSMPGLEGLELVRRLRERDRETPILVLTVRREEREKVRLLDAGADDYVTKPFGIAELLARVRALLRRKAPPASRYELGGLHIDLGARSIRRGNAEIHLTPTEFELLKTLLSKPGAVWTHRQLIAAIWGGGAGVTNDTVRVHLGSLRRKIEKDPNRPRLILTEPWVGYRLVLAE
jgi:two-component system KDP operon response regulator KdpE